MSETLKVTSPYDLSLVGELSYASEAEIEQALKTANACFKDRSKWLPKHKRVEILENLVSLMKENREDLAKTAASEGGKPWQDTLAEVDRAIHGVKLAIYYLYQHAGEKIPMDLTASSSGRLAYTSPEPIGPVVSLSAFNHPLNLIVHQTIPAVAVGAPVIVKPAETTPLSCFKFVGLLHKAGLPKEWCQPVICSNELAEKLATDSRIGYLSFIGSARVGWYLNGKLAPGTRAGLEHGGAAPVIVESDAELKDIVAPLVKGGFYHAGQVCVSVQRVFVHESQVQELTTLISDAASKLKVGDPLDPKTEVGPLILPREVERVDTWVKEAISEGAELKAGGEKVSETCYKPTVLLNPPSESKVSKQEIFGPVVCIYSYSDRDEAIERANGLPYAFQASVFTKDLDRALDTSSKLNAAAVMINDHTAFRVDWMPFGGRDESGLGMGGVPYSMHEMSREKLTVIKR